VERRPPFLFHGAVEEGLKRGDYGIRIPAARSVRQDGSGRLTEGPDFAAEEPMDRPELIDAIHLGLRQSTVVFGPRSASGEVRVQLGTAPVPPPDAAVVTSSPSPGRSLLLRGALDGAAQCGRARRRSPLGKASPNRHVQRRRRDRLTAGGVGRQRLACRRSPAQSLSPTRRRSHPCFSLHSHSSEISAARNCC
jgi:hypothetical protein